MTGVPVPAMEPPKPIDRPLWRVQRDQRWALAVERQRLDAPGLELLITLNGAPVPA